MIENKICIEWFEEMDEYRVLINHGSIILYASDYEITTDTVTNKATIRFYDEYGEFICVVESLISNIEIEGYGLVYFKDVK